MGGKKNKKMRRNGDRETLKVRSAGCGTYRSSKGAGPSDKGERSIVWSFPVRARELQSNIKNLTLTFLEG